MTLTTSSVEKIAIILWSAPSLHLCVLSISWFEKQANKASQSPLQAAWKETGKQEELDLLLAVSQVALKAATTGLWALLLRGQPLSEWLLCGSTECIPTATARAEVPLLHHHQEQVPTRLQPEVAAAP